MTQVAVLALLALTTEQASPTSGELPGEPPGQQPGELPDQLPPLDDALIESPSPVKLMAEARLRAELDDSRDFSRANDASAGAAITARVGVDASLDVARIVVVVGDGGRIGQAPTAVPLVEPPPLSTIYRAELVLDAPLVGLPTALRLGRMPVIVADGRWVGTEPFDPRGRTLDGAKLEAATQSADVGIGVYWLGGGLESLSGLLVVDTALRPHDAIALDAYLLGHRDGVIGLVVPTIGTRLEGRLDWLSGRFGADMQAPLAQVASFTADGYSGHAELAGRATGSLGELKPYAELNGEITAGDVVEGRVWRAPAPTQHGVLGDLDFFAADNTWSSALHLGATDDDGLVIDVAGRITGVVDRAGPLLDPAGNPLFLRRPNIAGIALVEIDSRLTLPIGDGLTMSVGYALGVPGRALIGDQPAQRFLVTLHGVVH